MSEIKTYYVEVYYSRTRGSWSEYYIVHARTVEGVKRQMNNVPEVENGRLRIKEVKRNKPFYVGEIK